MGKTAREKKIISLFARHRECRTQDSGTDSRIFFPRLNGSAVLSSRIHLADSFQDASTAYSGNGSRRRDMLVRHLKSSTAAGGSFGSIG